MKKDTEVLQPSNPTNVVDEAVNEEMDDSLVRAATTGTSSDGGLRRQKTMGDTIAQTGFENVSLSARVESSDEASLGDQEDASKQGRKINDIDADIDITLVNDAVNDQDMFDVSDLAGEEVFVAEQGVPNSKKDDDVQVNTAATTVSTASTIPVTTATTTPTKGILLQEPSESITTTTTIPSKDKAKIDVDYQLAQRLQAQEQEELAIKERAKLFQQLLEKRRNHFAAKRAEEKRNRPPTKAQQRSIMCTYLKNMAGWKPNDLKNKSFDSIQKLFDKAMKRVNTFVDMDTKLVKESSKKADAEMAQESSSKRAGDELE
ncbi:hypothetical protein Tco_1518621 [Tanacetum coccineum]